MKNIFSRPRPPHVGFSEFRPFRVVPEYGLVRVARSSARLHDDAVDGYAVGALVGAHVGNADG